MKTTTLTTTSSSELLCSCTGLNIAGFKRIIESKPDISFDEILEITGAGTTCTACLLDLEYNFVTTPRAKQKTTSGPAIAKSDGARRSFKRWLFDFIDSISPSVSFLNKNRVAIIRAPDMEQRVWVGNASLLFEGEYCAPQMEVTFTVFDAEGHERHRRRVVVEPNSSYSLLASDYLDMPCGSGITVGSVEIVRRALVKGYRGTTRPQTEIIARNGACNVHGQAFKIAGEHWFGTDFDPESERIFLTFMNFRRDPLTIDIAYPVDMEKYGLRERCHQLVIAGNGTGVHELSLVGEELDKFRDKVLLVRCQSSGDFNCYIVCAAADFGNFSLDHL